MPVMMSSGADWISAVAFRMVSCPGPVRKSIVRRISAG
jgi:hypothetical protein